jgi:hypothetical protein
MSQDRRWAPRSELPQRGAVFLAARAWRAITGGAGFFEEIRADENGIEDFLPREIWKQYMRAVVPDDANQAPTERKTGLNIRDVETARLVRDGRGWLRLAAPLEPLGQCDLRVRTGRRRLAMGRATGHPGPDLHSRVEADLVADVLDVTFGRTHRGMTRLPHGAICERRREGTRG